MDDLTPPHWDDLEDDRDDYCGNIGCEDDSQQAPAPLSSAVGESRDAHDDDEVAHSVAERFANNPAASDAPASGTTAPTEEVKGQAQGDTTR